MTLLELIENLQAQYDNMGEDLPVYVLVAEDGGRNEFAAQVEGVNSSGDLIIHTD